MENPCKECNLHKQGINKSCEKCRVCKDRIDYVRWQAENDGMISSISANHQNTRQEQKQKTELPFLGSSKKEQKKEEEHKVATDNNELKKCLQCGFECEQKEIENHFSKHAKTDDGWAKICKKCHGGKIKKGHHINPKPKKQTKKQKDRPKAARENTETPILTIDFSNYLSYYRSLVEEADKEFRTPESQLLYLIVKYIDSKMDEE